MNSGDLPAAAFGQNREHGRHHRHRDDEKLDCDLLHEVTPLLYGFALFRQDPCKMSKTDARQEGCFFARGQRLNSLFSGVILEGVFLDAQKLRP